MSPLKRHVQVTEGFLELGLPSLAEEEIDAIDVEHHTFPVVLRLKVETYRTLEQWRKMEPPARVRAEGEPNNSYGWVNWVHATRRAHGLEAAREILLRALGHHPEDTTVRYNLACYECQLGHLDEARKYLLYAFRISSRIRAMARSDPDLVPLRGKI